MSLLGVVQKAVNENKRQGQVMPPDRSTSNAKGKHCRMSTEMSTGSRGSTCSERDQQIASSRLQALEETLSKQLRAELGAAVQQLEATIELRMTQVQQNLADEVASQAASVKAHSEERFDALSRMRAGSGRSLATAWDEVRGAPLDVNRVVGEHTLALCA